MDAMLRRYMDILYKYVLEVPIPDRKPLYLPTDSIEDVEVQEQVEEENEGPPKKKQKKEKREKTTSPNLLAMQPHLFHLLRPLVKKHHSVRDALARCRAGDIAAFENVLQMVEKAVRGGLKEYEETDGKSVEEEMNADPRLGLGGVKENEEVNGEGEENGRGEGDEEGYEEYESSVEMVKTCRRPWWVVQPYVRPLPREALAKGSLTLSKKEKARLVPEEQAKKWALVPEGHAEVEKVGSGEEMVEVPREGLVCG